MTHGPGARQRALATAAALPAPASTEPPVEFESQGRLLIHGSGADALSAARALRDSLDCHLLSDELSDPPPGVTLHRLEGRRLNLSGVLGRFRAGLESREGTLDLGATIDRERPVFDLVLELGDASSFDREWGPPGHYLARDASSLAEALRELPALVGRVEKPRFFDFNAAACAHGPPGTEGCRRCIEICPAEAIASESGRIVVDPLLCQGGGACATSCPTGAITYRRPSRAQTLESLHCLITTYSEASGGERPVLVLLDEQAGENAFADWPERLLPWTLSELGSVGLETWLAALAFGASAVRLVRKPGLAPSIARALEEQLGFASALLAGLGLPEGAVSWLALDGDPLAGSELPPLPPRARALPDSKPGVLRAVLEHLASVLPPAATLVHALPDGAPFGRVRVLQEACTTCLACAYNCPTGALVGTGGELPQLRFVESECVQCGLCQATCPEAAIELEARLVLPLSEGRRSVILHEDEAFACVRCGTPFAPAATIRAITERLSDHPMFAGDALEILKCCDDCRLRQL